MSVTVRTRKVLTNRLLNRKQMIVDIYHPNKANVSRTDLRDLIAKEYEVKDDKTVFVFGLQTAFGGQKTTGFALIYDTLEDALDSEPKYRLQRVGMKNKREGSRKSRKELKNKKKKVRGKGKAKVGAAGSKKK